MTQHATGTELIELLRSFIERGRRTSNIEVLVIFRNITQATRSMRSYLLYCNTTPDADCRLHLPQRPPLIIWEPGEQTRRGGGTLGECI